MKIGDFGITKRIGDDHTALRTEMGTPLFQAPEIWNEDIIEYTNAVDIWSLGCVVYNLLTQQVPFGSKRAVRLFCSGKTSFPAEPLLAKQISKEGINFLKSLIFPDFSKRLTAENASQAPWLKASEEYLMEVERRTALQLLLSANFDLEAHGFDSVNALFWAIHNGHEKVVQILLDAGADINTQGRQNGDAL